MRNFFEKAANFEFENEVSDLLGNGICKNRLLVDRLANISMMGLIYYLAKVPEQYQYTRYDHTLAVAHLILRQCRELSVSLLETRLAVLAALCHDIGHGPFSHSSESYLRWKSGTHSSHRHGNHFTKIASILRECANTLPKDLVDFFPSLEALARAIYYVTQGVMPRNRDEPGAELIGRIYMMFDGPLSADVFDGDNRAFLSLSHVTRLGLSPCDPEKLIDAISSYGEMFVVDTYGQQLVKQFVELQGHLYRYVIQTKQVEAAEAMLARALELAYQTRKSRIGYSNLTDQNLISSFMRDPKSAKLWNDLEAARLFVPLSDKDPDLYIRASKAFPIQNKSLGEFQMAKKQLEKRLAQKLEMDPDFVIAQVLQPLSWKVDNIEFVPLGKTIGSKIPVRTKIVWAESQGMPLQENKRLEIYVPVS